MLSPPQDAIRVIGDQPYGFNDSTSGFPTPDGTTIKLFIDAVESLIAVVEEEGISGWEFRVRHAVGGTSNFYKIQSFEKPPVLLPALNPGFINLVSKKRFGVDMNVTSPISWDTPLAAQGAAFQDIQVEFVRNEVEDLPEFDGRFFVKVLADSTIKKAIIGQEITGSTEYTITDAARSQYINPEAAYPTGVNQWPVPGDAPHFFGQYDPLNDDILDYISIEQMSVIDQNKKQHAVHDNMDSSAAAGGETYWDWAGNTSFTPSTSSGWFIDKIEAFRPWKITGTQGWKYGDGFPALTHPNYAGPHRDDKYETNPAGSFSAKGEFMKAAQMNGNGYPKQLKLVGTNTHSNPLGPDRYLNQEDLKAPLDINGYSMVRVRDTYEYGGIIPSKGIDKIADGGDDIIHLSYAGTGVNETLAPLTSVSDLKTDFDQAAWASTYVDDLSFITTITQTGTLWRWKEDPDGIIHRTTGYNPGMVGLTQKEWNNNTRDKKDNALGISLYNYTQFQDYIVPYQKHFKGLFGGKIGDVNRLHFVSAGRPDKWYHGLGAVVLYGLAQLPTAEITAAADDIFNITGPHNETSGGWGGNVGAHYKYPSFTKEWGKARSRRRRYMFSAAPFIGADGEVIDNTISVSTLGNVPGSGNYLPTNDPELPSHFADATKTPLNLLTTPPKPSTDAPGIRPDGVYSGYGSVPSIKTVTGAGVESEIPGSCTFEIVIPYIETDDSDTFTTTNPAIWETEPKEDLDLDLYYEVGQIYPTKLDKTTMEQFTGPIREYDPLISGRNFNTKVTCFQKTLSGGISKISLDSGAVDVSGASIPGSDDIRVVSHESPMSNSYCTDGVSTTEATCLAPNIWYDGNLLSDRHVWLEDVNGTPLVGDDLTLLAYPTQAVPSEGDFLVFTREDGGTTESTVSSQAQITGPTLDPVTGAQLGAVLHNAYELDIDAHNYEVSLPWYNCYSFGNGVESNRIRDDYNQVFIDKGAKVSTVLEEPYLEDRRSSGLIYSGIYNSISCLLYTSPSPRDRTRSRMPSSA